MSIQNSYRPVSRCNLPVGHGHWQKYFGLSYRLEADLLIWLLFGLVGVNSLAGCGNDNRESPQIQNPPPPIQSPPPPIQSPPPPTEPLAVWEGYFIGFITDAITSHYSEALLTAGGDLRILIGDPSNDPTGSAQFVGNFSVDFDIVGDGMIIGQGCQSSTVNRFCETPVSATVRITEARPETLIGELAVTIDGEIEIWTVDMAWPTMSYMDPATYDYVTGSYSEYIGEFAFGSDVTLEVDSSGQLFFHSDTTGCTGSGALVPYLDGHRNVYETSVLVDGCTDDMANLNGILTGLSTRSVDEGGFWGDWLVIWLTASSEVDPLIAVTVWGLRTD
jgi:hypothetical protein